tara:strand:- start:322 stop:546 length:225 start_codon:yes stop_codon:yes gene_type:complete
MRIAIEMVVSFFVGVCLTFATVYLYHNYWQADKQYVCHAKKGFLLESLNSNSSVFVKTEPQKFCIDMDNKKGKK